jgi:tryptophanyl-tRNA synthetase
MALKKENKKRVFSGSRPTGQLHLGNYLGAVKGYISLQERKDLDCIYAVVDLHGITSPYNPKIYQAQIYEIALDYLACGLDPKKAHLIIQSEIPAHVELSYLLGTIYPVSRLEQLPTYKEKKLEQPRYVNLGLLYYPILMAADILIYKAELVPVGKDQLPHIEVTREIARKFNQMFGPTFPEPRDVQTEASYVPSLTGQGKMSKTQPESYINLTDDLKTIYEKLKKTPTDSGKGKKLPESGGVFTLLTLVEIFEGQQKRKEYEKKYLTSGLYYEPLKKELAEAIFKELEPIQERYHYFKNHLSEVKDILKEGRDYASRIALETLYEVKTKMGLI